MQSLSLYCSSGLRAIESAHRHLPLMQRAGAAAAEWAMALCPERETPILVLAGPGNNGGDAFEAARLLLEQAYPLQVLFAGTPERLPEDAAAAYQRFVAAGGRTVPDWSAPERCGLILDGLFGIGLSRAPAEPYASWINAANSLAETQGCPLLALDVPSGLDPDRGRAATPCIRASHTLSFVAAKPGLYTGEGPDHCGQLRIAMLGTHPEHSQPADGELVARSQFRHALKPRRLNSHKGSNGNAGILGGAASMIGAAFLAGRSALKLGAGRVYLGLLDPHAPPCDPQQAELMLRHPETLLVSDLTALAIGPGLGRSDHASELLERSLAQPIPLVLDADALNLLSYEFTLQSALLARNTPHILTPHPAEAARLLELTTAEVQADRIAAVCQLAERFRAWVVLKGCGSLIASPQGRWWLNTSGNPGMGTAGMGDVLSGFLVALLAQGWSAEAACLAAVHLHGAAADQLVAEGRGPVGLTSGEVIDAGRLLFNRWLLAG
ncbi:MAG: hypothetical protein RIR00_2216 [Pseudomonadota bacterium]|jgi:hydroxyethylthiazole kinase-like uncharacterized protein yjeF